MSESETSPTKDIDDLAARVDELLEQMQSACEEVANRFNAHDEEVDADLASLLAETEEAAPPEAQSDLEAQPQAEAAPEPVAAEGIATDTPAEIAAEQDDELGDELDALLREAEPMSARDASADAPAEADITSIEELDEQLAEATEALLDDAPTAPAPPPKPAAAKPAATKPNPPRPEPVASSTASAAPEQRTHAEPQSAREAGPAEQAAKPSPWRAAPIPDGRLAPVIAFARVAAQQTTRAARTAAVRAEPAAKAAATALAKPLDAQPAVVRQTIGWIALWTIFLAACVWLTLAMFRSAPTPPPAAQPNSLSEMRAPGSG